MRAKVRDKAPHWRNEETVRDRYLRLCTKMHMPHELYELTFEQLEAGLSMNFRKNAYIVSRKRAMFGKNIIITDNTDWTTPDIVQANLDRWQVEEVLSLRKAERKPSRRLETPSKTQAEVLSAFGYHVDGGGVLQQNNP
jgi:hypothetical protein